MKTLQAIMDKAAIGFSALCAIHCVFMPIILAVLPALTAASLGDELFHKVLLIGVLPLSGIALITACRHHQKWAVLSYGFAGLYILVITASLGHEFFGESGEKIATVVGASVVAYSHIRNFRLCSKNHCHEKNQ